MSKNAQAGVKTALSVVIALAVTVALATVSNYPREVAFMAGVFALAGCLWASEAIPIFSTAIVVIGAQVILLSNPGAWPHLGFADGRSPTVAQIIHGAADPVLVLFVGGFMLARAAEKTGVGLAICAWVIAPFRADLRWMLLGVMGVTALFSMWMSNTATAAMMITVIAPMLAALPKDDPFRKALALAVAFSANIGGLGTPIASPPNAVALGYLQNAGLPVGFLTWMLAAAPLMIGLLGTTWVILWRMYPPARPDLPLTLPAATLTRSAILVVAIFTVTVLLWLTTAWHGLPATVVALLPMVALTASGVLSARDVNSLDWTVVILIAGGISLGVGMQLTGFDAVIASWLPYQPGDQPLVLVGALVIGVIVLSTFMSNTAVANLLLPVGLSAGLADSAALATQVTVSIAWAASLAMSLPISTPPNAIVYARGVVETRDMARVGVAIGVMSALLIVLFGGYVMRFWGIVP